MRLRERDEVVSLGESDIRTLDPACLPDPPDLAVADVSFISLKLILPALDHLLRRPAELVALIKPQFEAGRTHLKKGVVRDPVVHDAVCADIVAFAASRQWNPAGIIPSPIQGGEGNREFLMGARIA
jgi:23S rRNA (cytidine1920-2'-O)/16S rRNA (cytidine1409-2'-O)-methyltransferase